MQTNTTFIENLDHSLKYNSTSLIMTLSFNALTFDLYPHFVIAAYTQCRLRLIIRLHCELSSSLFTVSRAKASTLNVGYLSCFSARRARRQDLPITLLE